MSMVGLIILLELALLLAISVVDLRQRRLPNRLLALAVLLAAGASLVWGQPPPLAAAVGGGAGLVAFWLLARARPGALGMGDVKLAGVIGLMVGFPHIIFALLFGMIAAGLVALTLALTHSPARTLAYAPYLALGALPFLLSR
jgi:leader peptidase (prepilin peptidase)/N-methyltransferase